jgi:hypothetical protein
MRGRSIPLSLGRRLVVDLTRMHVPSVPVQRIMDISGVKTARAACAERPPWAVLFVKAYALVAAENPILRRAFVKLPWAHLYEYPQSAASFVVEREYENEMIVLTTLLREPDNRTIAHLAAAVRSAKNLPIDQNKNFRRMLSLARWPTPIRRLLWFVALNVGRQRGNFFGTFGLTVYSGLGAESLHPISPLTAVMNYGVIGDDGIVAVRIMYDHRVLDGSEVARVLGRIEDKMNHEILDELKTMARAPSP